MEVHDFSELNTAENAEVRVENALWACELAHIDWQFARESAYRDLGFSKKDSYMLVSADMRNRAKRLGRRLMGRFSSVCFFEEIWRA